MKRGFLVAVVACLLLVEGALGAASSDWYRQRDFSSLYHGARLVRQIDVYDDAAWCREARGATFGAIDQQGNQLCPAVFLYPLWTAVALLPLGGLPVEVAASLWLAISIAGVLLGARWAWLAAQGSARGAPLFIALVVAGQPFWLMFAGGQISGVLLFGAGLGTWLLAQRREATAGAALAILALKPHVLGLEALALLVRAVTTRSRGFVVAAVGAVVVLLLASLPFGASWPLEWLRESLDRQTGYSSSLATAWGLAAHDLGNALFAPMLIAIVVGASLKIARGIPRDPVAFTALAVPLSLFTTPYTWSYDFVVLAIPWALVLARSERAGPMARRALMGSVVIVASPLAWLLYVAAFARGAETLSASIPALTALLVAAALRVSESRDEPARAASLP